MSGLYSRLLFILRPVIWFNRYLLICCSLNAMSVSIFSYLRGYHYSIASFAASASSDDGTAFPLPSGRGEGAEG